MSSGVLESIVQGGGSFGTPWGSQVRVGEQTPNQQLIPIYQGSMVQLVSRYDGMPLPEIGATGGARAAMSNEEQRWFEKFRKMDPPQFQGDQREDAYEFLVSCHEGLQSVGLVQG